MDNLLADVPDSVIRYNPVTVSDGITLGELRNQSPGQVRGDIVVPP